MKKWEYVGPYDKDKPIGYFNSFGRSNGSKKQVKRALEVPYLIFYKAKPERNSGEKWAFKVALKTKCFRLIWWWVAWDI